MGELNLKLDGDVVINTDTIVDKNKVPDQIEEGKDTQVDDLEARLAALSWCLLKCIKQQK